MSFTGNLEHLPIVDIIQLLHSTRKTGTLYLTSEKGESQLVFNDGYIVSANHSNNSIRIGQILLSMNMVSQEQLESALKKQQSAGAKRKPLIATLIEDNHISSEEAYKGLETLIEMSIVEVLTWKNGTFSLDVYKTGISDEYRYFPETLKKDISMDAQGILMDALRIYDEKMRDGSLTKDLFCLDSPQKQVEGHTSTMVPESVTADLLGLDNLEQVKSKIPDVFQSLNEHNFSDHSDDLSATSLLHQEQEERQRVYNCLNEYALQSHKTDPRTSSDRLPLAVVTLSKDDFIKHVISSVCSYDGISNYTADDTFRLADVISKPELSGHLKLIVIDTPSSDNAFYNEDDIISILESYNKNDDKVYALQLFGATDYSFSMRALLAGADAIIPRPLADSQQIVYNNETVDFIKVLQNHLRTIAGKHKSL